MVKDDVDNNKTYRFKLGLSDYNILDSLGLSNIWIHQTDIDVPFNLIRQRIFDTYKQSWYSSINNSNRLEMYARY